ncbi:MAG TPA: tetratricopeptide repeat protein [Candidatus Angelobacter sp.]
MQWNKWNLLTVAGLMFISLAAVAHDEPGGMKISTKSPQAHAYFEKGLAKMEMLHIQEGLDNLRLAVKADPQFALGHILLTFFSQDPTEQVEERQKALDTRPSANLEEQYIVDWLANASQAHWVPAIQAMNEALQLYPRDKHLAWLAGWWLAVNQNQSPRAIQLFERVIQIDPRFADAWNEVAYCYAKSGNYEKAFADIKRYTELVPNEPNPQDSFAEISRMAGRFDDALKHYRMSLALDPTFHESQLGLGDTYALMGDQPRARTEYRLAIQAGSPVQKVTWGLQWAATYMREGDFTGADKAFREIARQAHEKDFANLEAEAYRSMALYQKNAVDAQNLLKQAEAELRGEHKVPQSLLNQELASVLRTRTELALHSGNSELAKAALQELDDLAAANGGDDLIQVAYHGAAGADSLAQGNFAEAVSHLEEDEANPISMRGLVIAYEKSGQKENSARLAKKLAGFNVPVIEQALVVPEFRKQQNAQTVAEQRPHSGGRQ